jgi:spore coat polysaccharide biosynthesis protein SpsF
MKILAITQARYGSTRLPAKILKEVNGQTLLETHLTRILKSKLITKLMVATTKEEGAEHIINVARKLNVDTYQGSVNDVLDRFYNAAKLENPDYVVRLTSDCPLIDPQVIDDAINVILEKDCDYVLNGIPHTYPDGIDVEVFKFSALEQAYKEAELESEREHVTPYIWKNSTLKGNTKFKGANLLNEKDYSSYRLTVDTAEDFELIKLLLERLGNNKGWKDYVDYIDEHKEVLEINSMYTRNEGYKKSLLNDKKVK